MEYELFHPADGDPNACIPFIVSLPGSSQQHVNGFSQRLRSKRWAVAVPLRPSGAPPLFEGDGSPRDGVWYVWECCKHFLLKFAVQKKKFLMVGVSNGGSTVLRFATLWPQLCCGLIAVTGCVHGLAKLPEDLKQLQGIPMDMYVGTNDECGFYEPMQSMMADLGIVGHAPTASLTVFQGAGHICSPLIEDSLIYGKLILFFLSAGNPFGNKAIHLPVKTAANKDPHRIVSVLKDCCGVLGLPCAQDSNGSLKVCAAGSSETAVSFVPEAPSAMDNALCAIHFKTGDAVEVWSNTHQAWISAIVSKVGDRGDTAGVTVTFTDSRGQNGKTIPPELVCEYVRRPGSYKRITCANVAVGDSVTVWSESKQGWYNDGEVTEMRASTATIRYCNGQLCKDVPIEQIPFFIKERRCSEAGQTSIFRLFCCSSKGK